MSEDLPDVLARRLRAARDHDAYWNKATRGRRTVALLRGGNRDLLALPEQELTDALVLLVDRGDVEVDPWGWRWREPVVPAGGDARMVQP